MGIHLGEKNSEKPHPKIIGIEERGIKEQKPPNDKIIDFNIVGKKSENNG